MPLDFSTKAALPDGECVRIESVAMSRVIRFDQFLPVERSKFLSALEAAGLEPDQFGVSKMEISPPLMPGSVTALVTVKLASSAIAFSYEDSTASSWVAAFERRTWWRGVSVPGQLARTGTHPIPTCCRAGRPNRLALRRADARPAPTRARGPASAA